MAEKSVSNPISKPAPVRQFPHLSMKVCVLMETYFQVPIAQGREFYLSMSGVLSEIGKAIVLSKSGIVKNYLFCRILPDTLVENWVNCF